MERHHEIPPPFLRMGLNQFPRHSSRIGDHLGASAGACGLHVRDILELRDIAAEAGASIASVRDDADMRSNAAIVPYTAKNGDLWVLAPRQWERRMMTRTAPTRSPMNPPSPTCDDGQIILDNGLLRAIIAPDGTVRSLIDLDNGHELVPDGGESGITSFSATSHTSGTHGIQRDAFLSAEHR